MEDSHSLPHSQHQPPDNAVGCAASPATAHVADGSVGSITGAKYRLMSPAKLPISRSACITIPPGLSPTSFLESPVLLSNIKAEPSPTTGSFFKPQVMQGSTESTAVPLKNSFQSSNNIDERTSSSFEFRFRTGASSTSGLPSVALSVPMRLNRNGPATHKDQYLQSSAPSSLAMQTYQPGLDTSVCKPAHEFNQERLPYTGIQASSPDHKDSISTVSADRTSEDGYNWRKYGQKLVKGSEFPRSYYKCTHPNCEVKKIFERSPSGHITEIVYKGSHGHPKPQTARRHNPGALMTIQEDKLDKDLQFTGQEDKFNTNTMEQNGSPVLSPLQGNEDGLDGSTSQYQGTNEDVEEDDPILKRRKMEDSMDVIPVVKPIREPRVVVQTVSEVDILDDGYRWRKYGQKVVRGNPNPRSYYKCTNSGCPVRKHVERASHDPKAVITTYEGKHNHDVPTARNSSHELAGIVPYGLKVRQQDSSSVSLDLGVGIGRGRTSETVQARETDPVRSQTVPYNSGMMAMQASQVPPSYGIVNSGLNLYENRENRVEGHSFQTTPAHPSNTCPPNIGRILMGP